MIERTSTILRAVFIATACSALARSLGAPFALLAVAALLTAFISLRFGARFAKVLAALSYLAITAAAVISWSLMVVLMVHGESTELALVLNGLALGVLSILLSLSPRRTLSMVTAIFGFLVAGLHRNAAIAPFVLAGAFAAITLVVVESIAAAPRRIVVRPSRRALAGVAALVVAVGLSTGLPPAQLAFERTLFSLYTPPASARSGLSTDDVRLGEVESLASSSRVALHVWAPRAQKLRARVYLEFDGRLWHAVNATALAPTPMADPAELKSFRGVPYRFPRTSNLDDSVITRVLPIGLDAGLIPTPGDALAIKTRDQVQIDPFGIVLPTRLGVEVSPYAIVHRRHLGIGDTGDNAAGALTLPRVVDPRLRDVAARIVREAPTERERIARTITFIQSMAHYDLDVGKFRTRDPIAEFLFIKHRGYCEYFASALALMLRLEGIPARFVTGYQVDDSSLEGSHYVVRDSDAHAWVEAHIAGVGWVEADATPPGEYANLHGRGKSSTWTRLRAAWADFWIVVRHGSLSETVSRLVMPVSIAVLIAFGIFVVRRSLLRRPVSLRATNVAEARPTIPAVIEVVAQIDRAFEARGVPRPRAHGLLEHLSLVEANIRHPLDEHASSALRRAIDLVHRRHFGAEPVADADLRAAARALMPFGA